jgi:hypothetical protein
MTVVIATKTDTAATLTLTALNTETILFNISAAQSDDYLVEGYVDLVNLATGDTLIVTEYLAIDGTNYRIFNQVTYNGAIANPAVRFYTKMFYSGMLYKVTLNQTAGTLRSFVYRFIQQVTSG